MGTNAQVVINLWTDKNVTDERPTDDTHLNIDDICEEIERAVENLPEVSEGSVTVLDWLEPGDRGFRD